MNNPLLPDFIQATQKLVERAGYQNRECHEQALVMLNVLLTEAKKQAK